MLIHFPIALCMTAVAFDYLAQWRKSPALATADFLNISIAAAITMPVVATGLMAWQRAVEGQKLKGILSLHLILGCLSSVLIWVVFSMHFGASRHPGRSLSKYRLFLEVATVLLMGLTAHLGGFLSGVNSQRLQPPACLSIGLTSFMTRERQLRNNERRSRLEKENA